MNYYASKSYPGRIIFILLSLSVCWGCQTTSQQSSTHSHSLPVMDIQGHRGCRGHLPENTIPAFLKAIDMGVHTLEMDVVISKDQYVVLSHEPFLSHEICFTPTGEEISEEDERNWNIYQMTYEEIKVCDCGSKTHIRFPDQQSQKAHKPLLSEVIKSAEAYASEKNLSPLRYNIETKSTPEGDGVFHPEPEQFVDLLVAQIKAGGITARTTIQSFDIRTLQLAHRKYPEIELVLLIENEDSPAENLEKLGFVPDVYSPYHLLVNSQLVSFSKEKGMKVIPWTLNEESDIRRMLELKVDGIISDYPDRVVSLLAQTEK